jgi:hypothetical protein
MSQVYILGAFGTLPSRLRVRMQELEDAGGIFMKLGIGEFY